MTWYMGPNPEEFEASQEAMAQFLTKVFDSCTLAIGAHQKQNADQSAPMLNYARENLAKAFETYIETIK